MTTVVGLWVLLQGVGWALVHLPHVPGGFTYSPGAGPADYPDAVGALHVSLVTLVPLGFEDVVATDPWIRPATPLEAPTGFALLTAAPTWCTRIRPPLSRRRSPALDLKFLAEVDHADGIAQEHPVTATRVLDGLAADVAEARIDFTQHGETYYFQEEDPDLPLAHQLPCALELRDRAAPPAGAQERPPPGPGPGAARAGAAGGLRSRGRDPRGDLRRRRGGPPAGAGPLTRPGEHAPGRPGGADHGGIDVRPLRRCGRLRGPAGRRPGDRHGVGGRWDARRCTAH